MNDKAGKNNYMYEYIVKDIGNSYGGLKIKEENNKFYWIIDGYGSDDQWFEIPKNLFLEILPLTEEFN